MATAQQIEANRHNAQLSTGPQTGAGKAISSRNSTSHGLSAAHLILPGEDAAAFNQTLANLTSEHAPQGETEFFLVRQLAQNQWKLDRFEAIEASIYHVILEGKVEVTAYARIAAVFMGKAAPDAAMDRLERYRNSARSAWHKANKELRATQSFREKREIAEIQTNPIAAPPPENETNPIPRTDTPLPSRGRQAAFTPIPSNIAHSNGAAAQLDRGFDPIRQ